MSVVLDDHGGIDPLSLPDPFCWVVWTWMRHHPDMLFMPRLECPNPHSLDWDDLHAILVAAGILTGNELAS